MSQSFDKRLEDINRFYEILEALEMKLGGKRTLAHCDGRMHWPERGVYFFFEPVEMRSTSGVGQRVVRVGTHAVTKKSRTTLWNRLSQHQGTIKNGSGNHRGSVFRHHVGTALIARDGWNGPEAKDWNISGSANRSIREAEVPLEIAVSKHICAMPFLWVAIEDNPGRESHRGYIERNAIALLSNYMSGGQPVDPASENWLGRWAKRVEIRHSHLWNVNHVVEAYDNKFLLLLKQYAT
jgi:hypothetical protein